MEKPELLRSCVEVMSAAIRKANPLCACCVKIRCFEDTEATVALARMLEEAGCQCLTVHGRTRGGGGGKRTGKWLANWDWIRSVKLAVSIPVVSNGNIRVHRDIESCLQHTGADCVMSGCGALKRPFIFSPSSQPVYRMGWENDDAGRGNPAGALGDGGAAEQKKRKGGGNQWERRLQCACLYLRAAAEYDAHPRQIAKHLQEMVPRPVLRREAAQALGPRIIQLAAGTNNHAAPADLEALSADLELLLQDLATNSSSLPAEAYEISDSDEDAGGEDRGGG
jgi:tRNA-dihydrouridine synthase